MKKPPQGQGSGAGTAPLAPSPSSPPAAASVPAPKFCPSCGKLTNPLSGGKSVYCEACEHVFDEHGQGRPADFRDQLKRLQDEVRGIREGGTKDPRVDRLDGMVQKLSEGLMGKKVSLDQLDPDDPVQVGKFAMAFGGIKAGLLAFLKPRPKAPAPPAGETK